MLFIQIIVLILDNFPIAIIIVNIINTGKLRKSNYLDVSESRRLL